jgi:hypothetical protein
MPELNRYLKIETMNKGTLYARVTDGQYEVLTDRGNHSEEAIVPLYAQSTPTGDVGKWVVRLKDVEDAQLWEPTAESGFAREWPESW